MQGYVCLFIVLMTCNVLSPMKTDYKKGHHSVQRDLQESEIRLQRAGMKLFELSKTNEELVRELQKVKSANGEPLSSAT